MGSARPPWLGCVTLRQGMRETLERPGAATCHAREMGLNSPAACINPPRARELLVDARRACSRLRQRWRAHPDIDAAATARHNQSHAKWSAVQSLPCASTEPPSPCCTSLVRWSAGQSPPCASTEPPSPCCTSLARWSAVQSLASSRPCRSGLRGQDEPCLHHRVCNTAQKGYRAADTRRA